MDNLQDVGYRKFSHRASQWSALEDRLSLIILRCKISTVFLYGIVNSDVYPNLPCDEYDLFLLGFDSGINTATLPTVNMFRFLSDTFQMRALPRSSLNITHFLPFTVKDCHWYVAGKPMNFLGGASERILWLKQVYTVELRAALKQQFIITSTVHNHMQCLFPKNSRNSRTSSRLFYTRERIYQVYTIFFQNFVSCDR
jgi:hypothetical protein